MARIALYDQQGQVRAVAIVDDRDAEQAEHRWFLGTDGYVVRRKSSARQKVQLHREVLGLTRSTRIGGQLVRAEHVNGDRLDNRRDNLRMVSHAEACRSSREPQNVSAPKRKRKPR